MEARSALPLVGDVRAIQFSFDIAVLDRVVDVLVDEVPLVLRAAFRGRRIVVIETIRLGKERVREGVNPLLQALGDVLTEQHAERVMAPILLKTSSLIDKSNDADLGEGGLQDFSLFGQVDLLQRQNAVASTASLAS